MNRMQRVRQQASRRPAQLERDAALRRVSRVRRWTLAGAAGLTGGVAALVSAVAPGHSLGAKRKPVAALPTTTSARKTQPKMPPLASAGALGLQGPAEAPQAAPAPKQSSPAPVQTQTTQTQTSQTQAAPTQAAPTPAPAPTQSAPAVAGGS
jgi:hypothetical protein